MLPTLALALLLPAAPVPKETEKAQIEKLYGVFADPDKSCETKLDGDTLKLTLKGGTDYVFNEDKKNLPRFTREVKGDFVAFCRSRAVLPKGAKPNGGKSAWTGGGLVVITKDDKAYRAGMQSFDQDGKRFAMTIMPGSTGAAGLMVEDDGEEVNDVWTRFTRQGKKLAFAVSRNGLLWSRVSTYTDFTDEPVRVGVYALHNLTTDSSVTLDKFSLSVPKEEKK